MRVSIIGTGNVASVLGNALLNAGHTIVSIHGRDNNETAQLASQLDSIGLSVQSQIDKTVEIAIIAISDDFIGEVSSLLSLESKNTIVVHTSGSVPLYLIDESIKLRGVFYPLQTFKKGKLMDFSTIPICLNAGDRPTLKVIQKLAETLSKNIYVLSDDERIKAHLAAVMVNNFTNHLISSAYSFLEKENLPISIIQPLIKETFEKLLLSTPDTTQTGPARRNDSQTIDQHLKMLEGHQMQDLYQSMTDSIIYKFKTNDK